MFFPDPSCTANVTIQKIYDYGIYSLIGADWVAITTITFAGRVFIDAWKDLNGVDQEIPLAFLEEHQQALSDGAALENIYFHGLYILVIRFRASERYACYNIYCKKARPFEDKDIAWLKNYSRANLEITRLNNENIQNQEYINTVFDCVSSSILALDADGRIIVCNRCAVETFELPENAFEVNFLTHLGGDAGSLLTEAVARVLFSEDQYFVDELKVYSEDNNKIFNITLSPLRDSKENVNGVVLVANDITNQKMIELELEQLKQFGLLGDIAAGLAHDIKNPLMNLLGCARIAVKGDCPVQTKDEMMRMIQHSAGRINSVVEQMLSYSRLNQLHDTMVDVNEVIRSCIIMAERQRFNRVIQITAELSGEVPKIRASSIHIQQIFLNILLNALQSIECSGEIQVESRYEAHGRIIQVTVSDNGAGIPEEMRKKIFNPYFTTKSNGTGLGLFIVRRTLAQYNGAVEIISKEGQGTCCRITLPLSD